MLNNRAGEYFQQATGYKAFIPKPLPPDPPLNIDSDMIYFLSKADRCLGRLDGITQILPNPDLFVAMYVKKEALISSQIEGTQASLVDVLEAEDPDRKDGDKSVEEVVNYVRAMNYGLDRLNTLPLSKRLIQEIHSILLEDVRGSERAPGEFRRTQNWLGHAGSTLLTATFVPPPPDVMNTAMNDLELFFHSEDNLPPLIKIGLIHAQFETIHPFLDGNGRIGRLLITFWLCQQEILTKPLLYLSYYFKRNRSEYYDRLMDIRFKGDWEGWLKFFLKGLAEISEEATNAAKAILGLKQIHSHLIEKHIRNKVNALILLDVLFEHPIITVNKAATLLKTSYPTASGLISKFVELGILKDDPTVHRNKKYQYKDYIAILESGTD
ncbi:MAG: Fic family protein [Syntrophomonadaceae bacterium]